MLPFLMLLARPSENPTALQAALNSAKSPAASAALIKDGKVAWVGGKKADGNTVFRIASLTKAFTATTILQMVNEKKFSLESPLSETLPSMPAAWKAVTVRQLLNHTSGVPSYTEIPGFFDKDSRRKMTPAEIAKLTANKPLDFPSGSKFSYDNTGYILLGMIAERYDKKPFADVLKRRIFAPLRMSQTKLDTGGKEAQALGFDAEGKPAQPIHMSVPYAAGSIVSTANDMAKWVIAQGSEKLLPPSLWAEMFKPTQLSRRTTSQYGFAWGLSDLNGVATIEHSGGINGFSSEIRRVPSKNLAVVVLVNSEGGEAGQLATSLLQVAEPSLKPSTEAIADPDPKVTQLIEKHLRELADGKVDKSILSPEMAERLTPETENRVRELLTGFGPFKTLRLTQVDGLKRSYIATFGDKEIRVLSTINAENKIAGLRLAPM